MSYECFGGCGKEFETLDEMEAINGQGYLGPRHFCEGCAERIRNGGDVMA